MSLVGDAETRAELAKRGVDVDVHGDGDGGRARPVVGMMPRATTVEDGVPASDAVGGDAHGAGGEAEADGVANGRDGEEQGGGIVHVDAVETNLGDVGVVILVKLRAVV